MIKHTELRCGNLYDQFGNIHAVTPAIIADLQKSPEGQLWFKPIPLTDEWYDKIDWDGYKDLCINSYFKIDKQGHVYYHGDYTGINLLFVHSLQNFYFAIRRKELTFKDL